MKPSVSHEIYDKLSRMQSRVFAVLIVFFVLFSLLPTGYELFNRNRLPAERTFELVHNFPTDYNFYLSRIRQGLVGRSTVIEQYTGEPHEGSFIQVFYLGLGWLGRWWRVPGGHVGDIYHVARIVFGIALLSLIAQFCKRAFSSEIQNHSGKQFFGDVRQSDYELSRSSHASLSETSPSKRKGLLKFLFGRSFSAPQNSFPHGSFVRTFASPFSLIIRHWSLMIPASLVAFLLAATASTWPKLVFYEGGWRFGGFMPWWSLMDSLQRITFIPHIIAGQSLIIALLLMLTNENAMRRGGSWVFVGLLGFALGIIFPPGLLFVYVVLFLFSLTELFFKRNTNRNATASRFDILFRAFLSGGVFIALSVPALLYFSWMTSFYPWRRLVEVDIIRPLPFDYLEYFKAVGPILPLGLIGLFVAVIKKEKAMAISVAWVAAWLFLLFAFQFIPQQSPLRFSEMLPHVPLAVLTAYLFYSFYRRAEVGATFFEPFGKTQGKPPAFTPSKVEGHSKNARLPARLVLLALPAMLVLLNVGIMISSYWWQRDFIDHKIRAAYPLVPTGSYVMYPLKDFVAGIQFIEDNTPKDAVIFSETTAGNYIPAKSGRRVYLGHDNTVKYEEKQALAKQFFSGKMKADEARIFFTQNNLHYIFFGPQEKEDGGGTDLLKIYPFLKSLYTNGHVSIYLFD